MKHVCQNFGFQKKRTEESVGVIIDRPAASDGRDAVETGEIRQLSVAIDVQVASNGRDAVESCESRQLVVERDVQVAFDHREVRQGRKVHRRLSIRYSKIAFHTTYAARLHRYVLIHEVPVVVP